MNKDLEFDSLDGSKMKAPETRQLRSNILNRLLFLEQQFGSRAKFAAALNVNRTQMNRYLNGESIPRAELLAQFGQTLNIPLDWFFGGGEPNDELEKARIGKAMQEVMAGRETTLTDRFLPDGIYLYRKQRFSDPKKVEVLLGRVSSEKGIKTFSMSMVRFERHHGNLDTLWGYDKYCRSMCFRSGEGLGMISSDGTENVLIYSHLSKIISADRALSVPIFLGECYCRLDYHSGALSTGQRSTRVKIMLEKLPNTAREILSAGRKTGLFSASELDEASAKLLGLDERRSG